MKNETTFIYLDSGQVIELPDTHIVATHNGGVISKLEWNNDAKRIILTIDVRRIVAIVVDRKKA